MPMTRTVISIDQELYERARERAEAQGVSFAEFVRTLLVERLREDRPRVDPSIFQKESLRLIRPSLNSKRSHPRTSIGSPVAWVPRIVHSDTPRSLRAGLLVGRDERRAPVRIPQVGDDSGFAGPRGGTVTVWTNLSRVRH